MKKILLAVALAFCIGSAFAQSGVVRGESSAGNYQNILSDGFQRLVVTIDGGNDPCLSNKTLKSAAIVSITTATTTQLVALSGTTKVYVCGFSLSISQVATTANTIKFVYGTGASCGTGTTDLTGAFGAGGITAAAPIVVSMGSEGTDFATPVGQALCATTTIGATAFFTGVITYVQQ